MDNRSFLNLANLICYIVLAEALLILSAVAEGGTTEWSRLLVPRMSDVPEMMEHILAAAVITVAGVLYVFAVTIKNDGE